MAEINKNLVSYSVEIHLCKLLEQLSISDYALDISAGSIKGDNYLGIIANVKVQGKNKVGKNTTLNLIVKSAPCNDIFRKHFPIRAAYEREIYIYSKVLPEFTKLQQEKDLSKPFTSFAKFYNSTMEDLNEALIMEDMKEHGFKLWNRFEPVDYNHALLVMRNYGKFHALSFALRDQKPGLFAEFSKNTQELLMTPENTKEERTAHMQGQVDNALAALDPIKDRQAYERLNIFREDMMDKLHAALKSEEAGNYAVIGHGDCWINNMLFKYQNPEDPKFPTELCLLDWQLSRLGSPALDLGYFIFTCTDQDLRNEHYQDLIHEYYSTLAAFLRELGSDPEKLFPYKVLQEHLKRFSVYGLFMAVMILHFINSEVDEIPDINSITDEEDAKKKFSYVSKNIDKYHARIKGVVLDFIKYDYYF